MSEPIIGFTGRDLRPWYELPETLVIELESEEWGIRELHGRETPDGWEYAIVTWRHHRASAWPVFRNGAVIEEQQ